MSDKSSSAISAISAADANRGAPYIASQDLRIAAEVALELGLPLLLAGEPGTGKTTFANHLALTLAPGWFQERDSEASNGQGGQKGPGGPPPLPLPLYCFETKSTSVATDLFYRFDSLRRFHASHDSEMSRENRDYLSFEALGKAILFSRPWQEVRDLLPEQKDHPGAGRSVVLIDEIDKAPRDFPNDLLNEIDRMFFRIPEVQAADGRAVRRIDADPALRPLVVLTSNSEKNLPQAFLRRCVFHHIRFPEREQLRKILAANLTQARGPLADAALEFFYAARDTQYMDKPPTTAELVQWLGILQTRRWTCGRLDPARQTLADLPLDELQASLGVLGKTSEDLAKLVVLAAERRRAVPALR